MNVNWGRLQQSYTWYNGEESVDRIDEEIIKRLDHLYEDRDRFVDRISRLNGWTKEQVSDRLNVLIHSVGLVLVCPPSWELFKSYVIRMKRFRGIEETLDELLRLREALMEAEAYEDREYQKGI